MQPRAKLTDNYQKAADDYREAQAEQIRKDKEAAAETTRKERVSASVSRASKLSRELGKPEREIPSSEEHQTNFYSDWVGMGPLNSEPHIEVRIAFQTSRLKIGEKIMVSPFRYFDDTGYKLPAVAWLDLRLASAGGEIVSEADDGVVRFVQADSDTKSEARILPCLNTEELKEIEPGTPDWEDMEKLLTSIQDMNA